MVAFEEFKSCKKEEFVTHLKTYNRWVLSSFDFLLKHFSANEVIQTKQDKREILKETYKYKVKNKGKDEVLQFNFADKLIGTINSTIENIEENHGIDEFTCQNISNIINNLSKVGLTSTDLQGNRFAEAVTDLINDIFDPEINKGSYNFNSQDISLMLNGLSKLGYKKEDLEGLKLKELVSRINELVKINNNIVEINNNKIAGEQEDKPEKIEFIPQHISNILNSLPQLGYTSADLKGLKLEELIQQINNQINNFNPINIANTFNGLSQLKYTSADLEGLNLKELMSRINVLVEINNDAIDKRKKFEGDLENLEFKPQEITNTINGLSQLGYKKEDLSDLNIGNLIQLINKKIKDFNSQDISLMLNGLSKLGYKKEDLEGLKLKELVSRINELVKINNNIVEINNNKIAGEQEDKPEKIEFIPQHISNILNSLPQLGYTSEELKSLKLDINGLIELINAQIKTFNPQNIANTFNGLAQLGYTSADLEGLELKELMSRINALVEINNKIADEQGDKPGKIEFIPQNIANTFNGLSQLGYKKGDLEGLNFQALIQQINKTIKDFDSQSISLTLNGLAQLGYKREDLSDLNFKDLVSRINELVKINNDTINKQKKFEGDLENLEFKPQNISLTLNGLGELGYKKEKEEELKNLNIKALIQLIGKTIKDFEQPQNMTNTLHGLGKIGYKFYDFEESNIIPNLLKKFSNIQQKDKTILNYLILMKGLMDIIYDHKQTLTDEQKQYLNELKETISGDVEQIVKEAIIKYNSEIKRKGKTSKEKENLVDLKEKLTKFEGLEKKGWVKASDFKSQSEVQKEQKPEENINITFDETDTKEREPEESINITFDETDTKEREPEESINITFDETDTKEQEPEESINITLVETDTKEQKQEKQKQKQQEELEQLKQDKQKLKEEQQQLETDKENLESRQQQLELDRQTIEAIRDELKLKQQQLKEGQDKLLNDTTQLKLEQQQLETDKENLESRQQQLKEDRNWLKSEQTQLKEGQNKLKKEQKQLEKDKENLESRQQQLKEDRNWLKSEQTQLKEGQNKLKKEQKKLEKKEKNLKSRQEQLEKDEEELKLKQEKLELERQTIEAMRRNELKLKEATERCKNAGFILLSTVGVMAAINKAFTNAVGTVLK